MDICNVLMINECIINCDSMQTFFKECVLQFIQQEEMILFEIILK